MTDVETELKHTVMARLSLERLSKFPFVLKLWVMTNDPQVKILQWNANHSAVIVNLAGMRDYLQSSRVSLFACRHLDEFLWLLQHAGFVEWGALLAPDHSNGAGAVHKQYRHRMFVYANNVVFERWLLDGLAYDGNIHLDCGFPLGPNFYGSRRLAGGHSEFEEVKASISYEMLQLQTLVENECSAKQRECSGDGGAGSSDAGRVIEIEVPPQYIDVPAMEERTGGCEFVAGNYGPVPTEALIRCLGEMLPVYVNEPTDEVKVENGAAAEDGVSCKTETDTDGDGGGSLALGYQAEDVKMENSYDDGTSEHDFNPSVAEERSLCLDVNSSRRLTECVLNVINPPKAE